jgi:hypothetical protein
MKEFLKKIYLKIYTKPLWFSLLVFILLLRVVPPIFLIPFIICALIYDFPIDGQLSHNYSDSLFQDIVSGGIIAPIIETLFFQTFFIWLFRKVCKFNYFMTIFLSGFLFGLSHALHSVLYALVACMGGFFLHLLMLFTRKNMVSLYRHFGWLSVFMHLIM